ncbi:uncharacterized protein BDR25DRAFT_22347 [Lindgomyces ingoldianus]|uniref:Uncharacterized protein n=1 Tax=Lindgomyces ingoldianus TaxID=673940 RepID=A0ACB6QYT8_9PLEO|nr:uncharacterized protein BDR25DRAFT_22347 [Lindgomyces ingoldianus]KAF2471700.1 hypothetical protein BDR25DRAFT_22347 [Lindgomyces ingoldianus]
MDIAVPLLLSLILACGSARIKGGIRQLGPRSRISDYESSFGGERVISLAKAIDLSCVIALYAISCNANINRIVVQPE